MQTFTFTKTDVPPTPKVYVLLKNTSNWSNPTVWAWVDGNTNCTVKGSWPGDAMTKDGDYWRWDLPEGKATPLKIIFSDNGSNQTRDLDFSNGSVYDCSGKIVEGGDQQWQRCQER